MTEKVTETTANLVLPGGYAFEDGLIWPEYLETAAAAKLQQRRYDEEPDEDTLAFFRCLTAPRKVIILCMPRCNDCAWSVPHIVRLIDESPMLEARIFHRDLFPEVMDSLLTNGKRSVPKVGVFDSGMKLVGSWGPRPQPIQQYVEKIMGRVDPEEWKAEVLRYYHRNGLPDQYAELRELFRENESGGQSAEPFTNTSPR